MGQSGWEVLQKRLIYRSGNVDYRNSALAPGRLSMQLAFGIHVVDLDRRELRRGAELIAVEPQVFDLLAFLLENRHRVVSKDDLTEAIWSGRVIAESTLTSRINAVRKAIADDGEHQRLVRTYARKGFRFVGDVHELGDGSTEGGERNVSSAQSVAADARPAHGKPVLAVLPFKNLNDDPEQEYFSDGVTEDIITALSRNRSILVTARTSSFAFKDRALDVREIGRNLGAAYIVDGSIRRLGDQLRVSAELIASESGSHVWADRYDRQLVDLFQLQDEIAATIAARIEPEIGSAEQARVARKPHQALEGWDLLHLGTRQFYLATQQANAEAQRLFRRAIDKDPALAQAYAYLSYAIVLSMIYFDAEPEESLLDEAVDLARTAAQLDEQDAMIRFVYGRALLARRSYTDALSHLEMAVSLNPNLPIVYCGLGDSLTYEGRISEAIPFFEKAIEISPFDPQRWAFCSYRALAHLFAGEFERALQWANNAIRIPNCHFWPFAHRVSALGHCGREGDIEVALKELFQRKQNFTVSYARSRLFYIKKPDQLKIYTDGLRRAGVPD
jgi:TolB-like protein/Tfp pilus assembly protein PilF